MHLSSSSRLHDRYHCIHHLLIPLTRRWGKKLSAAAGDEEQKQQSSTADDEEDHRQRDERKEKTRADDSKDAADADGDDVVQPLHQFLSCCACILLTTLPVYLDTVSHEYLSSLLSELTAAVPTSVPLLLSSLSPLVSASSPLRYPKEQLAVADAAVQLLESVREHDWQRLRPVADAIAAGLIAVTERLLDGEGEEKERRRRRHRYDARVQQLMRRLLHCQHGALLQPMLDTATSRSCFFTVRLLLPLLPAAALSSQCRSLLTVYEQRLLVSKDAAFVSLHSSAFSPLFPFVTDADFSSLLLPGIERQAKRSPELCLPLLSPLLSGLSLDLSAYHKQLLPLLLPELKHGEEERRKTAQSVLAALIRRSKDEAALSSLLSLLTAHLIGKHGALSQWQLRVSFLIAITSLAQCEGITGAAASSLSAAAIAVLLPYLDSEPAFEARNAGVAALSAHLRRQPEVSDRLSKHLQAGLVRVKDGNSVPAYVRLLLEILESGSAAGLEALVAKSGDVLAGHIKSAMTKPLQHRREGVLSIALLLLPSPSSSSGQSKACLPVLRDPASFLNSADLISSCGVEEADCYAHLLRVLLRHQPSLLSSADLAPFLVSIARLSLHKQWPVRRLLLSLLRTEQLTGPVLTGLLKGVDAVLNGKGGDAVPSALYRAVLLLLSASSALPPSSLPLLLWLSCDPVLCASSALCRQLLRHLQSAQPALEQSLRSEAAQIVSHLSAFACSAQRQQEAASSLLISLFAFLPSFTLSALLPSVLPFLSPPSLLSASEYEIAVFHTPPEQLCTVRREGELHVSSQREEKSANLKGRRKEDAEFERMQREIDRKHGKVDSDTKQRLAEQQQLRDRLRAVLLQVTAVLGCFQRMTQEAAAAMPSLLSLLLPAVYPLLRSPLAHRSACELHISLLRCLDSHLRGLSLPLCLSLQLVEVKGEKVWTDPLHSQMLKETLRSLRERVGRKAVSVSSWLYISPLVSAVLLQSREAEAAAGDEEEQAEESKAGQDDDDDEDGGDEQKDGGPVRGHKPGFEHALAILTAMCAAAASPASSSSPSSARYPLSEFLSLLLHLLNHAPSQHSAVCRALLSLSPALTLSDVQSLLTDSGIFSVNVDVRSVVLEALMLVPGITSAAAEEAEAEAAARRRLTYSVYVLCQDEDSEVKDQAVELFDHLLLRIAADYLSQLQPLLSHPSPQVRSSTSAAIASALLLFPATATDTLSSLLELFRSSTDVKTAGRLRGAVEVQSRWETRDAVALTLRASTASFSSSPHIVALFTFFLSTALRDDDDRVWSDTLRAGLELITAHGALHLDRLLALFTQYSALRDADTQDEDERWRNDRVREGSVILMGNVARHMQPDSEDLLTVMSSLVAVLQTPSHSVQRAAAECIAPLMQQRILAQHAASYLSTLMSRLATGDDYATRKGAAFGVAAIVKGLRLQSLRRYSLLSQLSALVSDRNSTKARQGALFLYDRLFAELGSKFEPYVTVILPHLLANFGDLNADVREAAQDCAKSIMQSLTGHAVKMVLPLILASLHDSGSGSKAAAKAGKDASPSGQSWRTKLESISLLGTMAHLNPQQLSTALPMIVPRLLDTMTDPNAKVQQAAKVALRQIGSVIRNPEIAAIVPVLLAALSDPSLHTRKALSALIHTSFVHSVDPPSLALMVPIVKKGLKGRTAPTKKMAAQVVGSMCSLIGDVRHLLPYAATLLRHLRDILVDPIPEVRTVSAKALGSLYAGIRQHDESFSTLLPDLLLVLHGDTSSVQRSGAAQGLAQVLMVDGIEKTKELLPSLFADTRDVKPVVREGFFNLFTALPDAFAEDPDFADLIADIFPVVVAGLADEIGLVREAALAAGQSLVLHYATSQTELLLPALEQGLVAEDWRIRQSSVQLIGLLILRLAGLSGRYLMGAALQLEDDDDSAAVKEATTVTTRAHEVDIENILGLERRNRVFALMYLLRSDAVSSVREMGWRVWKGCVTSTPRMLNTVLPTLMSIIILDLAAASPERQHAAQSALGELVQKLGESVLTQIVPILQSRLDSEDERTRQGVCLGVSEVISVARKADIAQYFSDLIPSIRDALCDSSALVRQAAGRAFMTLYRQVSKRAIDEIVPALLDRLDAAEDEADDGEAQLVLGGIREVLISCNEQVLPFLLPVLTAPPLTLFHTKALAALSDQLGRGMQRYMAGVTNALLESMAREREESVRRERQEAAERLVQSAIQADSVQIFLETLTAAMAPTRTNDRKLRIAACQLLASFASHTRLYYDSHLPLVLQSLLSLWTEEDVELVCSAWDAVDTIAKYIPDDRMSRHVAFIRSVLSSLSPAPSSAAPLHGLTVKRGLAPLLPGFQHALLHGTAAQRVEASDGLGELVQLSSEAALAPHVIKLTGPLIRIVGDRFPSEVKSSLLRTLDLLIVRCGRLLRPFLPQLQTTFIKSLQDADSAVRWRAAAGLSDLMTQSTRVDAVLSELLQLLSASAGADKGVKPTVFSCLSSMLANSEVAGKLSAETRGKAVSAAQSGLSDEDELTRKEAARCLADALKLASPAEQHSAVTALLVAADEDEDDWSARSGQALALAFIARLLYSSLTADDRKAAVHHLLQRLHDPHEGVAVNSIVAVGEMLAAAGKAQQEETVAVILPSLLPLLSSSQPLMRQLTAERLQLLARASAQLTADSLEACIPPLLRLMADSNGPVRRAARAALYYLLQMDRGDDRRDRIIQTVKSRVSKKGAEAAAAVMDALTLTVSNTLSGLSRQQLSVRDELRREGGLAAGAEKTDVKVAGGDEDDEEEEDDDDDDEAASFVP